MASCPSPSAETQGALLHRLRSQLRCCHPNSKCPCMGGLWCRLEEARYRLTPNTHTHTHTPDYRGFPQDDGSVIWCFSGPSACDIVVVQVHHGSAHATLLTGEPGVAIEVTLDVHGGRSDWFHALSHREWPRFVTLRQLPSGDAGIKRAYMCVNYGAVVGSAMPGQAHRLTWVLRRGGGSDAHRRGKMQISKNGPQMTHGPLGREHRLI